MLLCRVAPDAIQWGRKMKRFSLSEDTKDVVLEFHDGTKETISLLVGADGIHSAVRKQLIGDELRYLGVIVILGIVRSEHPLIQERIFETVDGTTRIYAMPFTSDCSMWQLSFPCDEARARALAASPPLLLAEALSRCAGWHRPVPELLSATPPSADSKVTLAMPPILTTARVSPAAANTAAWNAGIRGAPSPPAATSRRRKSATTSMPVRSAMILGSPI